MAAEIPELLSPVGSFESLRAAVFNGANAVYLGASCFGARSSAGFDLPELEKAIRFAHEHKIKVYVTLNTLIKESEMDAFLLQLSHIVQAKADAVIVQDFGALHFIKKRFPNLEVHASTQMSIHNINGVLFAKKIGLDRVVMAREASIARLAQASKVGISIEAFVHGAQCVSVSGQCLLSSLTGGRSGNRGKCAQSCRLDYTYRGKKAAWLSPKDLCTYENIGELIESGVSSFKIEGRLKSPEYVAVVTNAYRKKIDSYVSSTTSLFSEKQNLLQVFNRGNFSLGHIFGETDFSIMEPQYVAHVGIQIGKVLSSRKMHNNYYLADVLLNAALNDQDFLDIRGANKNQSMIYSGHPVEKGNIATLRLRFPVSTSDVVYRLADAKLMQKARESYSAKKETKIKIAAEIYLSVGRPAKLILKNDDTTTETFGNVVQYASSNPLSQERIIQSISKTGNTQVVMKNVRVFGDNSVFVPISDLNDLRRRAINQFIHTYHENYTPNASRNSYSLIDKKNNSTFPAYRVYVESSNLDLIRFAVKKFAELHILFAYASNDFKPDILKRDILQLGKDCAFVLPQQIDDKTLEIIHSLIQQKNLSVVINNIAQLNFDWPSNVISGSGMHTFNNATLEFLHDQGCCCATISRELSSMEIEHLKKEIIPLIFPVFGRATMMVLNHCPERTYRRLKKGKENCQLCKIGEGTQGQYLTDRLNCDYPLMPQHYENTCVNLLLDCNTLNLERSQLCDQFIMGLKFTDETFEIQKQVLEYYMNIRQTSPFPAYTGRLEKFVE